MLKKIAIVLLAILAFGAVVMIAWYQVDGQPLPEAQQYLSGDGYSARVEADGGLLFTPAAANGHGLLIMHGALIKPLSYAKTAAFFAQQGYTVLVPYGWLRLSINAVDGAAARMAALGQKEGLKDWFVIGHSMGGFSSLTLISRHSPNVTAVALWASAMPFEFSALTVPMLFIRGDHDGLLSPRRFADAQSNLPKSVQYLNLPGGNHRGFAMYSHQFFDHAATIGWAEQIDFADEKTAAFFKAHF